MKLTVYSGEEDEFTKDSQFAYKDGKIFDIFKSEKSYCAMGCIGRMRAIVDKDKKVLQWIYPLMGGGNYNILSSEIIDYYKKVISAKEKFDKKED